MNKKYGVIRSNKVRHLSTRLEGRDCTGKIYSARDSWSDSAPASERVIATGLQWTNPLWLLVCLAVVVTPLKIGAQPVLSGMTMYGCSANDGSWNGRNDWKTVNQGGFYSLYLYTNGPSGPGWLNSGSSTASLTPNLPLSLGTNVISFSGDSVIADAGTGFNFFFDNDLTNNRISVVFANGGFSAVGQNVTTCGELSSIPGSGSLAYFSRGYMVTLSDLHLTQPAVDLVSPFSTAPNGIADTGGSFTLTVTKPSDLQLTIEVSQVKLSWFSQPTQKYQIQYRSTFTTNQWVNYGTELLGDGQKDSVGVAITQPNEFFRIIYGQ